MTGRTLRVLAVAGTRPEAIKIAPLFARAAQFAPDIELGLLSTGQHRGMLDQVFEIFGLTPDLDLNLMRPNQNLSELAASVMCGVDQTICDWKPDAILVQGDTTSCFAAAIAAFHRRVRIGHIEAGLRTHDLAGPWPEEMNRRLVDPISDWCFAPTEAAAQNLRSEGIAEERITVTGNTIVEALADVRGRVHADPPRIEALPPDLIAARRLILVTGHRRESFGEPLAEICAALLEIASAHPDVLVIYVVHANPEITTPVTRALSGHERIKLIPPLNYREFIHLMDICTFIISDSGGIQEEAPSFGKPVLVTRHKTERREAVDIGIARLVGHERDRIVREAGVLLENEEACRAAPTSQNPFGDGRASERILATLAGSTSSHPRMPQGNAEHANAAWRKAAQLGCN